MSAHTPTPWHLMKDEPDLIEGPEENLIVLSAVINPRRVADAAHIVRSVNSHAALVEALKVCLERLDEGEGQPPHYHRLIPTMEQARAALAAAEQEVP
jgi:hypothetical protein